MSLQLFNGVIKVNSHALLFSKQCSVVGHIGVVCAVVLQHNAVLHKYYWQCTMYNVHYTSYSVRQALMMFLLLMDWWYQKLPPALSGTGTLHSDKLLITTRNDQTSYTKIATGPVGSKVSI